MWIVLAFGSAFFAGITSILAKIGIRQTDSHLATALRTIVVLGFAWAIVLLTGSQATLGQIPARSFFYLGLSGMTTGASWICYFRALQLGDVNKVTPIDKSSTILTMLFAFLLLGESLRLPMILGMILIALGTWLMIQRQAAVSPASTSRSWLAYALGSALCASLTSILGKVGIEQVESNLGTALRTIVVLVMAWAIVFAQGKHRQISAIDPRSWIFILLSGLTTGLSWLCYYRALQLGPAAVVAPIDKLSLLVTVLFAYLFLKEKLSRRALIGLILLTGGTLILLFPF